ncbi:hypothetical protein [Rhizobium sp. Leaf262]|uniref:hypothetical protein n=1 Tax=Rhizobium sp. Leaf262 TaxID=1736312 RepID=UPI0012E7D917|nr:hypothetical protein [Rhizobium sp. Leaf262]
MAISTTSFFLSALGLSNSRNRSVNAIPNVTQNKTIRSKYNKRVDALLTSRGAKQFFAAMHSKFLRQYFRKDLALMRNGG